MTNSARIRKSIAQAAAAAASQTVICMYGATTDSDTIRAISAAERIVEEIRALGKVGAPSATDIVARLEESGCCGCGMCLGISSDTGKADGTATEEDEEYVGFLGFGDDNDASGDADDTAAERAYMAAWATGLDESAEAAHDVAAAE